MNDADKDLHDSISRAIWALPRDQREDWRVLMRKLAERLEQK